MSFDSSEKRSSVLSLVEVPSFVCIFDVLKMPALTKTCPGYHASVHVRKSMCDCGHCFVLKCKVSDSTVRKSVRIVMRHRRALETIDETRYRQEQFYTHIAKRRALETQVKCGTMCRQHQN